MKHLGLFEGIGGFSIAAMWAGWQTVAWCEWNDFCQKILSYHFPKAEKHGDIRKADFTKYRGKVDIITGGFPCQPYSVAGKRLGTDDERHLWPEMLRAIREAQPRWVVGENVSGIVSWNGGLVFEQVHIDLENEGYEVQAFVLPASGVNAPHRRDRAWFVAFKNTVRNGRPSDKREEKSDIGQFWNLSAGNNERICANDKKVGNAHNTNSAIEQSKHVRQPNERKPTGSNSRIMADQFKNFPNQPPICGGDDGLPTELDGITIPKWRTETVKAYGNAIVPQVAFQIFKAINEYESKMDNRTV